MCGINYIPSVIINNKLFNYTTASHKEFIGNFIVWRIPQWEESLVHVVNTPFFYNHLDLGDCIFLKLSLHPNVYFQNYMLNSNLLFTWIKMPILTMFFCTKDSPHSVGIFAGGLGERDRKERCKVRCWTIRIFVHRGDWIAKHGFYGSGQCVINQF